MKILQFDVDLVKFSCSSFMIFILLLLLYKNWEKYKTSRNSNIRSKLIPIGFLWSTLLHYIHFCILVCTFRSLSVGYSNSWCFFCEPSTNRQSRKLKTHVKIKVIILFICTVRILICSMHCIQRL